MTSTQAGSDSAQIRKARGAFFTPAEVCRYLTEWAIRSDRDAVLEPSCGEAAFLVAAAERMSAIGPGRGDLHGVEVHPASAVRAREVLAASGHRTRVEVADFFTREPVAHYDAVIGNPPFVRYQDFTGAARERSRAAAARAGVELTGLASSWAAFVVHSALFLKPGGRLALVLPAELLSVNYAVPVRQFLLRRFARVRLVLFTERIFPGVQEEVLLLLAEGGSDNSADSASSAANTVGTDHCEVRQVSGVAQLLGAGPGFTCWYPATTDTRWTTALLPGPALDLVGAVAARPDWATLQTWGQTRLGAVTGNNAWFTLSPAQVAAAGLDPDRDLVRISPPGSRHLRGLALTPEDWNALGTAGSSIWLFRPASAPSPAGVEYIAAGERAGIQTAYKCRVRTPWWRVPLVRTADLLLTYMNSDTPRLTTNGAAVRHLNSVHGVQLHPETVELGTELLPLAALNSLTLLGAETVGRAYGGGMLKIEPTEAGRLPLPAPELVRRLGPELAATRPVVAAALAAGQLLAAVAAVDDVLLAAGLGLSAAERSTIHGAHALLAGRRTARSTRTLAPAMPS